MHSVIQLENVSKQYQIGVISYGSLRNDLQSWWARRRGNEDPNAPVKVNLRGPTGNGDRFWVLKDICLDVQQGTALGIIGINGAGKSTLLKIISRITAPTKGVVRIKGRVASLLEVGTGFHPELTGRENIFLNGTILGMKVREIRKKFDEIVDFAGLDKFIDTPVKRYSSGMYVRLAFAVAAHLDGEILLVDEVLAVGDHEFQKKCLNKAEGLTREGRTLLFVTHNISMINKLCDRCIVLSSGQIAYDAAAYEATSFYLNLPHAKVMREIAKYTPDDELLVQILQISTLDKQGNTGSMFHYRDGLEVRTVIKVNVTGKDYRVYFVIHNSKGEGVFTSSDDDEQESYIASVPSGGLYQYRVNIPGKLLIPDVYFISMSIADGTDNKREHWLCFEIKDEDSHRATKVGGYGDYSVGPEIAWEGELLDTY